MQQERVKKDREIKLEIKKEKLRLREETIARLREKKKNNEYTKWDYRLILDFIYDRLPNDYESKKEFKTVYQEIFNQLCSDELTIMDYMKIKEVIEHPEIVDIPKRKTGFMGFLKGLWDALGDYGRQQMVKPTPIPGVGVGI